MGIGSGGISLSLLPIVSSDPVHAQVKDRIVSQGSLGDGPQAEMEARDQGWP